MRTSATQPHIGANTMKIPTPAITAVAKLFPRRTSIGIIALVPFLWPDEPFGNERGRCGMDGFVLDSMRCHSFLIPEHQKNASR
jgi:hypothetical protein